MAGSLETVLGPAAEKAKRRAILRTRRQSFIKKLRRCVDDRVRTERVFSMLSLVFSMLSFGIFSFGISLMMFSMSMHTTMCMSGHD